MTRPLRLFITPPYSGTPDQTWQLVHGFGPEALGPGSQFPTFAAFRTPGSGLVRAAGDGFLSVTPPGWWRTDPREPLPLVVAYTPPERVDLFLELSPRVTSQASFHARSRRLGGLTGFAYFNVERSSLRPLLEPFVKLPFQGGPVTTAEAIDVFIRGSLSIPVTAGTVIAHAAPAVSAGAPAGTRELGFAAVVRGGGLTDPSFVYDWMRDFNEDPQALIDQFIALSPIRWPIFSPNMTTATGIAFTGVMLFTWPALEEFRKTHSLTPAQWRTIGDNQKHIYRQRLLARAGRAPQGSTEPPFEFNDLDADNVFQLEAIVEFYANFTEPWLSTAVPRAPGDPGYIRVDFLDPEGPSATVSNRTVTLEGTPDLSRVRKKDTIYLEGDTGRTKRTYSINAINGNTVTLDDAPAVAGTTAWRINVKPVIVIIDPFGARQRSGEWLLGTGASVSEPGIVQLDGSVDLRRINARRDNSQNPASDNSYYWLSGPFDTIYFPSDQAATTPGRPARTYRILSVDPVARTVTVNGIPDFGGGASRWHIPAGLSGALHPPLDYNLGPHKPADAASSKGTDHYDGVVFVVNAGEVARKTRTSTYTSRVYPKLPDPPLANPPPPDPDGNAVLRPLSSICGNRRFNVRSSRGGSKFKNYCLIVEDFGAVPASGGEADAGNDTVQDARFFFPERVTLDDDGKKYIRLHAGSRNQRGNGSEGCLVSPVFNELRDSIVDIHLAGLEALNPDAPDPAYSVLLNKSQAESEAIWSNSRAETPDPAKPMLTDAEWNNLVVASLWVIRPDERPLDQE